MCQVCDSLMGSPCTFRGCIHTCVHLIAFSYISKVYTAMSLGVQAMGKGHQPWGAGAPALATPGAVLGPGVP